MEAIALHIEYLLHHHDCVILPGFGALISSRRPACYDEENGLFLPPSREICFNAAITNNDGLLINSISRRNGCSFEEARGIMEREIAKLRLSLQRDSEVTIGKIGVISRDEEMRLSFHPFRNANRHTGNLGLNIINLSALHATIEKPEQTAETPAEVRREESGERREHDAEPFRSPGYYYLAINKKIARIAAMLIVVVGIAFAVILRPDGRRSDVEANVVPVEKLLPDTPKEEPAKRTPEADAKQALKAEASEAEKGYQLIVASFRSEEEADRYISEHSESAWGLHKEATRSHWLVSAASASEQAPLLSLSKDSEFKKEYSESWVRKER